MCSAGTCVCQETFTWRQVFPTGSPPQNRRGHALVYDQAGARMIVFGGFLGSSRTNDLWSLSLSSANDGAWSPLTAGGTPPTGRSGHTAVMGPGNTMLTFGGLDPSAQTTDSTYQVSLGVTPTWSLVNTGAGPEPRYNHSAVVAGAAMWVFGGTGATAYNNAWALSYSSLTWQPLPTTGTVPSTRERHKAVYDAQRQVMVVHGSASTNDTYSLSSGLSWSNITPPTGTLPLAVFGFTLIHDDPNQRLILFGGTTSSDGLNDVWVLPLTVAGAEWKKVSTTGGPPLGRYYSAAIYDVTNDRMLVFAGRNGSTDLNDTWELTWKSCN